MKIVFSTSKLHPRDRFDYWRKAARKFVKQDSWTKSPHDFEAEIAIGTFGRLDLFAFQNSAMEVSRTEAHISRVSSEHLLIARQLEGTAVVEQDDREVVLEPGTLTLVDPKLPFRSRMSSGTKTLVIRVPRAELEARLGKTRSMLAGLVRPIRAEDGLALSMSEKLPSFTGKIPSLSQEIIADHTLDLIALSLANASGESAARMSSANARVLFSIYSVVETKLRNPNLDAEMIARAAGVSVRRANKILAEQGTSLTRLLQARRLARCRRALEDPNQDRRSLTEIAYSWGFVDMTHFGRSFKKAYKMLPSECRFLARRSRL